RRKGFRVVVQSRIRRSGQGGRLRVVPSKGGGAWANGRSRAAPHRADEAVVGLDVGAREPTEETHEPRVEGVAAAGRRRPVAGRRGRAERRGGTRAAGGCAWLLARSVDGPEVRVGVPTLS